MSRVVKEKLRAGQVTLGGWMMIGHPSVGELIAGEGFDWLAVDMEHTPIDVRGFYDVALAVKGTGCAVLARLPSCDADLAKRVLDAGADGIIVPSVNTAEQAARAVAAAKFPPTGVRGVSLCRATDFGRRFDAYFASHNDDVLVVVMLEHVDAVANADSILGTAGVDAALIGPYDLSTSMSLTGQLDHPQVVAAQSRVLSACKTQGVAAGIHVVPVDGEQVSRRIEQGFQFIGCGIDTQFILHGCRAMLKGVRDDG